jgi:uncharacterized protein
MINQITSDQSIVINEVDTDTPGTDEAELVELFDGGVGNTSLDGLAIVFFNGSNDASYAAFDLDGLSTDADGFFVLGNAAVANVDLVFSNNLLQNGADAVALYASDAANFPNNTPVSAINLVDAVVYDTSDSDDTGLLNGLGQAIQFDENANGDGANQSNSRVPDQTGTFVAQSPTPGQANEVSEPPAEITLIFDIQGKSHISPLLGESVTTTGIVTAVDSNGFYLQDATGDEDIATSDAIFVFTNSSPSVAVGDALEVSGTVSEFTPGGTSTGNLSTTQISSPNLAVVSSNNTIPTATIIGNEGRIPPSENIDDDAFATFEPETDGLDFFESLEGMRVTASDTVAVAATNSFGEIFTVVDNGVNATGISNRGTLNISQNDFNPEKVQIDPDSGVFDFDLPQVATGAQLGDITGVVSYNFGNFEIIPTQAFTATNSTLQPEVTTIRPGNEQLTIASYNVLNLDPNETDGDTDVANGRFEAIADGIVNNLNTPDLIALQEIQDNSGSVDDGTLNASETLQQLVNAIASAGGGTYQFIDNTFIGNNVSGGEPGGNIRTAILYRSDRVDLVADSVRTIGSQAPGEAFEDARLPLVATFNFNGEEITVVNNHFSSKGGSAPIFGVEQDFAARQEDSTVNGSLEARQAQARAVKDFVDGVIASNPETKIVALGDLNEFEFISPVEDILGSSLNNLVTTLPENERYSFNFQGNSQSLDHILVSDNLTNNTQFDIVHVNTEFAETDTRASDHDPLLASLNIASTTGETIIGTNRRDFLEGGDRNDIIQGKNSSDTLNGAAGNDLLEGGNGRDVLNGGEGNDTLIGGRSNDLLTGGVGTDTFFYNNLQQARDTITDFTTTDDVIDLSNIITGDSYSSTTPFTDYIKLTQIGADTVVRVDSNGDLPRRSDRVLVTLEEVSAVDLNSDNFLFG